MKNQRYVLDPAFLVGYLEGRGLVDAQTTVLEFREKSKVSIHDFTLNSKIYIMYTANSTWVPRVPILRSHDFCIFSNDM